MDTAAASCGLVITTVGVDVVVVVFLITVVAFVVDIAVFIFIFDVDVGIDTFLSLTAFPPPTAVHFIPFLTST